MALRPGRCTRRVKRPWTRVSKKKPRKSYVVGVPGIKVHHFEMGNKKKKDNFKTNIWLVAKQHVQIRHNAIEAARVVTHKYLAKSIGVENYFLKILIYPHQVLRKHSLATGAGADRFSQGMRLAFGKPIGRAAVVKEGQRIFLLKTDKKNLKEAREAFRRCNSKLPTTCTIEIK